MTQVIEQVEQVPLGTPANSPDPDGGLLPGEYHAYGAAAKLFRSRKPEILIEGPAGTGKTRAILEKVHWLCDAHPGIRVLLTRQTRESMTETVLVWFERDVLGERHPMIAGLSRRLRPAYEYRNGSSIVVSGLDKPEKVMSGQFDLICVFEATEIDLKSAELLTTRLRNNRLSYQQLICDCNPGAPTHWLNQRCQAGGMERLVSRHQDNPKLFNHALKDWTTAGKTYLERLGTLSGMRRMRLLEGRWVQAEGVVYDGWDSTIHHIPSFDIPAQWTRIRSIDFGFNDPFVCQWWAIDGDGRMFLYREIYRSGVIVADHAKEIVSLTGDETIAMTVSDHDAEDRATLHREGVHTLPAFKDISPGLQGVQARLRKSADGRARIFICRDALVQRDKELAEAAKPTCTAEEFDSYVWPETKESRPVKEVPFDKYNHGMDAMRYAVMHLDRIGPGPRATVIRGRHG